MNTTDQTGRSIQLDTVPGRIISLVPSQTELICALGAKDQLIGVTKFCVHPDQIRREKTVVGGTKQIHPERIHALQPDLIIANKEENNKEDIELLAETYPVWVSDVRTVDDAFQMIQEVGAMLGRADEAEKLLSEIRMKRQAMHSLEPVSKRVLYLIWQEPFMSIGKDTFIHAMLKEAGHINCCGSMFRYPELDVRAIRDLQPDIILLADEPFPFAEKHLSKMEAHFPGIPILLTSGEMWSWYGSRMSPAFDYLAQHKEQLLSLFP